MAGAHRDEVLHHALKLSLEKRIGVVGVSCKGIAVHLTLPRDKVIQQRNSDSASQVANKIADPRDLVELVAWHTHIVERTDRNEDERDADHLDDPVTHHGSKAHSVMNAACMEKPESGESKTGSDDDPWVELAGEDSRDRHHEKQYDGAGRKRHACLLRGVAEIILEKLRQQNGAAVQYHAEDETKRDGCGEVPLAEQPQIHDWVFMG